MHGLEGEQVLMRIHIGERDKYQGDSLYNAIIKLLHDRKYAGATAFRGIAGFGASTHMHSSTIELLSLDLPIVVECVETEEKIHDILPDIDAMMGGGLITLERAHVLVYRPHSEEAAHPDARDDSK